MKGESGKAPAIQWYYKDWLSDRKLQLTSPSTRGIWMNLLMHMVDCSLDGDNCQDGSLEDITINQIMRLGSCTEDEAWLFVEEAFETNFCEIESDKQVTFTIMSRRMSRDIDKRRKWRERQRKKRKKDKQNKAVTPDVTEASNHNHALSPTPTPTPVSNIEDSTNNKHSSSGDEEGSNPEFYITKKKRKLNGKRYQTFKIFWDAFDYKTGKAEAADSWIDIPQLTNSLVEEIIEAAKLEADRRDDLIKDGKTPKMAQGWLSGRRWEDEIYKKIKNKGDPEAWRKRILETQ